MKNKPIIGLSIMPLGMMRERWRQYWRWHSPKRQSSFLPLYPSLCNIAIQDYLDTAEGYQESIHCITPRHTRYDDIHKERDLSQSYFTIFPHLFCSISPFLAQPGVTHRYFIRHVLLTIALSMPTMFCTRSKKKKKSRPHPFPVASIKKKKKKKTFFNIFLRLDGIAGKKWR